MFVKNGCESFIHRAYTDEGVPGCDLSDCLRDSVVTSANGMRVSCSGCVVVGVSFLVI